MVVKYLLYPPLPRQVTFFVTAQAAGLFILDCSLEQNRVIPAQAGMTN